jgi:hypothetical protein
MYMHLKFANGADYSNPRQGIDHTPPPGLAGGLNQPAWRPFVIVTELPNGAGFSMHDEPGLEAPKPGPVVTFVSFTAIFKIEVFTECAGKEPIKDKLKPVDTFTFGFFLSYANAAAAQNEGFNYDDSSSMTIVK